MVLFNLNLTFTRMWHVTFSTNFLCHSQVTCEKIIKIYIYTRHSRVAWQIYWVTRKFHAIWTSLSCYSRVAREHWKNLLNHLQMWAHDLVHSWSVLLTRNILTAYYVMCKMHAYLRHLWIRLQLTHNVVYFHCHYASNSHLPISFNCCLIPSASAY